MVERRIYLEGGGDKLTDIECRKAFRSLLEQLGLAGRMPRLTACGPRNQAFEGFRQAQARRKPETWITLLVDSESAVKDPEDPWGHLAKEDGWNKPPGAEDSQALLLCPCSEALVAADPDSLQRAFGPCAKAPGIAKRSDLESVSRADLFRALELATKDCSQGWRKGSASFKALSEVDLQMIPKGRLPCLDRVRRILSQAG